MFGALMVTYGFIFFTMGLGKLLIPCKDIAITGVVVGVPMVIVGYLRLKKTLHEEHAEDEN